MFAKAYIRNQAEAKFKLFSFLCKTADEKRKILYSYVPPVLAVEWSLK